MPNSAGKFANRNNEESMSKDIPWRNFFFTLVEGTNHIMIFLVTGYVLYLAGGTISVTNVHAGLLTVGYVMLMSEAIGALSGDSILTRTLTRRAISHIHWVLQCLGTAFSIAGVVIMYRVKKTHFASIHAILGLSSVVIMIVLGFSGIPVMFAARLRKKIRPVTTKMCHNFLGITCFVLGMTSQCFAYKKKWMTGVAGEDVATACTVLTSLIVIFSLIGALSSLRRQIVSVFT